MPYKTQSERIYLYAVGIGGIIIVLLLTGFTCALIVLDEHRKKFKKLAITDALTGINNRHGYDEKVTRYLKQNPDNHCVGAVSYTHLWVGLYGLLKIMQINGNDEYREFLYKWFKENIAEGLPSKNINTTTPLLTLVELNNYYNDTQFEELCIKWAEWLMNCLPRTKERGFQHVTSANGDRQGVRLNENEMWIDTLFMTVLFLNKMGQKYNRQDWINESIHQVLMHIKYLCDNKTGLFYHGWTFNEMNNFGGIFWCRGNSWFTLGILDYVDMFKGTLNSGVKEIIIDAYKAQTAALKKLQSKSGLWHTVLTDSSSYEEVSGSAAITAGIDVYKRQAFNARYVSEIPDNDSSMSCVWV